MVVNDRCLCVHRNGAATWRIARPTTSVPLCQNDINKCISVNVPVSSYTDEQRIRPVTSLKLSNLSARLRSTTLSHPRRTNYGFITSPDDSAISPVWISSSDKPTRVAVAFDGQPSVIHSSIEHVEPSSSDMGFYDADSAVMARVAVIVRHLGLAVGVGACALAVGVVVVVTAIACRYRAATRASTATPVAHNGYRRAATDDKLPGVKTDDDGRARNGYKYGRSYGGSGRRWADVPGGEATPARASLIRCDGDGDAFVTSSVMMTSSSSRRGHVTEWFV